MRPAPGYRFGVFSGYIIEGIFAALSRITGS
jgi:hypothetical protein